MKKVLCTGASGFIGHHLIRECAGRGWEVIGVDKRPVPPKHFHPDIFIQADVNDLGYRDLMGVDYVFDLAFVTNIPNSVRHPEETTRQNIDTTIHLMEVCRDAKVGKLLFPSTASLYGHNKTPWTEDMPADPIEPYSWQKLSLEYACKMYASIYDLPTAVFRFFQVFGEFQRDDTALAAFMKAKQERRAVTLTQTIAQSTFRSGQRDFIYAGDLAEAVCDVAESKYGKGEIFNIASGKVHTMEEIADAIGAEVVWIPRREYEVERHEADISKIRNLGWIPRTDVLEWLEQNA